VLSLIDDDGFSFIILLSIFFLSGFKFEYFVPVEICPV
jgi:hypothetical protein